MRSPVYCIASLALLAACSDSSGPSRAAARLEAAAGNFQFGTPGQALALQLEARVVANDSQPLAGAEVTWSVASGAASLSSASAMTNANGISSTIVTLGAATGVVTVQASSPGLAVLTFLLYSGDPCDAVTTYTVGQSVDGVLTPIDCPLEGDSSPMDLYEFTAAAPTHVHVSMVATAFTPFTFLWDSLGGLVGFSIDQAAGFNNTQLRALVPAGRYTLGANTLQRASIGGYTLSSLARALDIVNCDLTWVTRGIDVAQSTHPTSCISPTGPKTGEHVLLVIDSGQTAMFEMTAAGFGPSIAVLDVNDVVLASASAAAGQTAAVGYTAVQDDIVVIRFGGAAGQTLPYQMRIN